MYNFKLTGEDFKKPRGIPCYVYVAITLISLVMIAMVTV